MCRGQNEWLTVERAADLSRQLRQLIRDVGLDARIRISLPGGGLTMRGYPRMLEDLVRKGAEFDAVEVPLKYTIKPILKTIDMLSLKDLQDATEEQYAHALAMLAFLRIGLRGISRDDVPIFLKLSVDNLIPHIMAVLLLAPKARRLRNLVKGLKAKQLEPWIKKQQQKYSDWPFTPDLIFEALEEGADAVVLFDSEKMPVFLPDPSRPESAYIPAAEGGYSIQGGAVAGKAIAKDTLKYTFEIARSLTECGIDSASRIVSSGGCDSGLDVVSRLSLGASSVEMCTVLLKEGAAGLVRVLRELDAQLSSFGRPWQELCALAQKKQVVGEIYLDLEFQRNVDKCECDECAAICWRSGDSAKRLRTWPPSGCIRCASCLTLCHNGGLASPN